ncbi:TRAP transporter small permease [Stappia sp.]|uniref:TRAP transporter small permease n=1 Tax=Stappia sp. TaxID=1870903 RepID=UPI003A99FAF8
MPDQPKAPVRPSRRTAWGIVEKLLSAGAGALLLALTFITCIDVVARYWFNAPLSGAYELTEMFLATLVFLALPVTTGRGEHVEVDLIDTVAGGAISRMARPVTGLLTAGVLAVFAWRLWEHALRLASDGAISDSLSLPIAPVAFLAAIGCGLASLLAASRALRRATA